MTHGLNCKFCQKPISVEVDDDYAALGDPYKILHLACCNFCGEVREERRKIYDKLKRALTWLEVAGDSKTVRDNSAELLTILTKRLMRLIGKWYAVPDLIWEEAIVDQIMAGPKKAHVVLASMWRMGKEHQRELI